MIQQQSQICRWIICQRMQFVMCPSLTPWVASSLNIEMMTFTVLFSMSSSSAPRLRPPPFSIEVTIKNVPVCLFRGEVNNPSHENFLLRKNPLKVAFNFVGIQLWAENLKLAHELHNIKTSPSSFTNLHLQTYKESSLFNKSIELLSKILLCFSVVQMQVLKQRRSSGP